MYREQIKYIIGTLVRYVLYTKKSLMTIFKFEILKILGNNKWVLNQLDLSLEVGVNLDLILKNMYINTSENLYN